MNKFEESLNKKILNPRFFKKFRKVALYDKEDIFFKHDRFCLCNLGMENGYKTVELKNVNSCAPFESIIIGIKTNLPEKWYVNHEYEITFEDGSKYTNNRFIDSNDIIADIVVNNKRYRFINTFYGQWGLDCPNWIDRIGIYDYLSNCLDVFKK